MGVAWARAKVTATCLDSEAKIAGTHNDDTTVRGLGAWGAMRRERGGGQGPHSLLQRGGGDRGQSTVCRATLSPLPLPQEEQGVPPPAPGALPGEPPETILLALLEQPAFSQSSGSLARRV